MLQHQFVHVQLWDKYINMYTSYQSTGMNYVAQSTGIHFFHIFGICSWAKYACPITYECPTAAVFYVETNITKNNQQKIKRNKTNKNVTLIYHVVSIYLPATNMPLLNHKYSHIPKLLNMNL